VNALVLSVLGASLLGSPHCAAMCGGFVCFFSGQTGARPTAITHAVYHAGRLVAYALLGLAAGMAGAGFDLAGRLAGFQRPAAVAAGILLILWGGAGLAAAGGVGRMATAAPAGFRRLLTRVIAALADKPPVVRALAIGLLTALLPCGWLYVFVATAAGTGSAPAGALVMAAFWAGTVPVLAGLGALAQRAAGPLRARIPVLTAAALVVLGLLTVAGKFQAPHASSAGDAPGQVQHDHH
jgi:sulfite exporter TauE/SafE